MTRLRVGIALAMLACAGCRPASAPPPPSLSFAGLPVSGNAGDARRAGFTNCVDLDAVHVRCRRHSVMLAGVGPYEAAVDLAGSDGAGGFDHLTLWHDSDNDALLKLAAALEHDGWQRCLTGDGRAGDQAIFTRAGAPVGLSMDISYWGKRRMRVVPVSRPERDCAHSVGKNSGTDR